jgi:hypothetical protein
MAVDNQIIASPSKQRMLSFQPQIIFLAIGMELELTVSPYVHLALNCLLEKQSSGFI